MELSGSLPLAGFKKCFSEDIAEKARTLNSKKLELNQSWPHKIPSQAYSLELQIEPLSSYSSSALPTPSNQSNSLSSMQQAIVLNGVLEDLFKHESNDRYMVLETRPGAVINNQHIRPEVMASMWVQHLFACALGIHLTSYKVGLDDVVELKAIDSATAQEFLKQLLSAYLNMWNELPRIACKTAWSLLIELKNIKNNDLSLADFNNLDELSDNNLQAIQDELHHKASLVFEDEYAFAELKSSSYLSRVFTSYEDIKSDIFTLTDILYSPLFEHANLLGQASHDD
jgi:exonuclease V gamma subunit